MKNLTVPERLTRIEDQIVRLASDHADMEVRMRKIEKTIWAGFGALAVLQLVINYIK